MGSVFSRLAHALQRVVDSTLWTQTFFRRHLIVGNLPQLHQSGLVQDSPFLTKLPPELRTKIYHHALTFPRTICVSSKAEDWRRLHDGYPYEHPRALLQTCKLIRQEASHIYYANNTFRLMCFATPYFNSIPKCFQGSTQEIAVTVVAAPTPRQLALLRSWVREDDALPPFRWWSWRYWRCRTAAEVYLWLLDRSIDRGFKKCAEDLERAGLSADEMAVDRMYPHAPFVEGWSESHALLQDHLFDFVNGYFARAARSEMTIVF